MVTLFKGHNFSFQNEAQHFCGLLEVVGIWILRGHENGLHQIVRSKIRFFLSHKKSWKKVRETLETSVSYFTYIWAWQEGPVGRQALRGWLAWAFWAAPNVNIIFALGSIWIIAAAARWPFWENSYTSLSVFFAQCDQNGRFFALWATFQSPWQQLFSPNCPHFLAIL